MKVNAGIRAAAGSRIAWAVGVLTVAGLFLFGQVIVAVGPWYHWDLGRLGIPDWLRCPIPFFCEKGFTPFFALALSVLALAALFSGLVLGMPKRRIAVLADAWARGPWPGVEMPRGPALFALGVSVGLSAGALLPLLDGDLPHVWLWALGILALLAGVMLWERQTSSQKLLARGDWLFVGAYMAAMVAGAFVGAGSLVGSALCGLVAMGLLWASLRTEPTTWLWDRRTKMALLVIGLGVFALGAYGLDSWRFSVIGDEWAFYLDADRIAHGILRAHPLSNRGTYYMHPAFSSYLQAAGIKVWGEGNYGWRVTNPLLVSWSLLSLYVVARAFGSMRMAVLAAAFYGASHYIMAFGKIGYNNLQALWPLLTSLALGLVALRRKSILGMLLSGLIGGLGFYVFAVGRLALPLAALVILLYSASAWRKAWTGWTLFLLGALLVVLPILSEPNQAHSLLEQTIFRSLVSDTLVGRWDQFVTNSARALTLFLSSGKHTHFVFGAHTDPLTGSLMLLGLAVLVVQWRRARASWLILMSFVGGAILLGGLTQYDCPPNTRMFALVPVYALIAAVGGEALLVRMEQNMGGKGLIALLAILIVLAAFALNAYICYEVFPARRPMTQESILVGVLTEMASGQRPKMPVYLIKPAGDLFDLGRFFMAAYDLSAVSLRVITLDPVLKAMRGGVCRSQERAMVLLPSNVPGRSDLVQGAAACAECEVGEVRDRSRGYHFEQVEMPDCLPKESFVELKPWRP